MAKKTKPTQTPNQSGVPDNIKGVEIRFHGYGPEGDFHFTDHDDIIMRPYGIPHCLLNSTWQVRNRDALFASRVLGKQNNMQTMLYVPSGYPEEIERPAVYQYCVDCKDERTLLIVRREYAEFNQPDGYQAGLLAQWLLTVKDSENGPVLEFGRKWYAGSDIRHYDERNWLECPHWADFMLDPRVPDVLIQAVLDHCEKWGVKYSSAKDMVSKNWPVAELMHWGVISSVFHADDRKPKEQVPASLQYLAGKGAEEFSRLSEWESEHVLTFTRTIPWELTGEFRALPSLQDRIEQWQQRDLGYEQRAAWDYRGCQETQSLFIKVHYCFKGVFTPEFILENWKYLAALHVSGVLNIWGDDLPMMSGQELLNALEDPSYTCDKSDYKGNFEILKKFGVRQLGRWIEHMANPKNNGVYGVNPNSTPLVVIDQAIKFFLDNWKDLGRAIIQVKDETQPGRRWHNLLGFVQEQAAYSFSSIKDAHDHWTEITTLCMDKQASAPFVEIPYLTPLNGVEFQIDGETYRYKVPEKRSQLVGWGKTLGHCIGSYTPRWDEKRDSGMGLLGIYKVEENGKALNLKYTLEILDLGRINQFKGKQNHEVEHYVSESVAKEWRNKVKSDLQANISKMLEERAKKKEEEKGEEAKTKRKVKAIR